MLPATGSTRIAARPSPYCATAAATASMSLYGQHDRVGGDARRNPRGRGDAERHQPRAAAREERVDVAVVVAGELDHAVSARRGAREANGAHRGLGARRDEAHHLDRGHGVDDLGGQVDLSLGRRPERRAPGERLGHRRERDGVGVAEEQRAPRHHPVDVSVAVDVLDEGALAAAHEERLLEADAAHGPHRRVDAARDQALRSVVEGGTDQSHRARSFAQYVKTRSAPARLIATSDSSAAACSSRWPAAAAAFTIAYSPETL